MLKKILAALLAAATVLTFAACKDEVENPPVDDNPPVVNQDDQTPGKTDVAEGEIDYEDGLSTDRYDGYNYRMLVRQTQLEDQYVEEDSEDTVKSAVYRRNKEIEEKYGITISATESSAVYETDALNSILGGDDAYDIIFTHSRAAFTYAVQGAAYNINDIKSIHLDKPWWSKNLADCDVNGYLYVLDGDISTNGLGCAMVMFFNKVLFDELGYDYPYQMVKDDEWTFDAFAYLVKKGGRDLSGDGKIEPEVDQLGFYTGEWDAPINILYSSGEKIYTKNDEGVLELTLYSNKTVEVFDDFFALFETDSCKILLEEGADAYTGPKPFNEGRALMKPGLLLDAQTYRGLDDDFGILPYPKYDEEDPYTTAINGAANLIVIPITVSDVERTGAITEALCSYGSKYVIPAFYDVSLKTKSARDEESEEMLDIIKDSRVYDLGYVTSGTFASIGAELARSTTHDFASTYAQGASQAQQKLAEFNRDYGHIEG